MAEFEFSRFLEEVSADQPCGENLEYDPLLLEIGQGAEGVQERAIGDSVAPGEAADWRSVKSKSLQALERTRDIQVGVFLSRASLHIDGLEGASQGLQLVHGLLTEYWDCVHPVKDEDDEYPVLRMNVLSTLSDKASFLDPLRNTPLTDSKVMGRFSLRQINAARNRSSDAEADDREQPNESQIDAAFMDTDLEVLEEYSKAATRGLKEAEAIWMLTKEKVGEVDAPDFSGLVALLKELQEVLVEEVRKRGGKAEGGVVEEAGEANPPTQMYGINNRQDVARALDTICEYFDRSDPSSPIPFMLQRARRLLNKDFKQILADLAPDGIDQANNIFGLDKDDAN